MRSKLNKKVLYSNKHVHGKAKKLKIDTLQKPNSTFMKQRRYNYKERREREKGGNFTPWKRSSRTEES